MAESPVCHGYSRVDIGEKHGDAAETRLQRVLKDTSGNLEDRGARGDIWQE